MRRLAATAATLAIGFIASIAAAGGAGAAGVPEISSSTSDYDLNACGLIAAGSSSLPAGAGTGRNTQPLDVGTSADYSACQWQLPSDDHGDAIAVIVADIGFLNPLVRDDLETGRLTSRPLGDVFLPIKAATGTASDATVALVTPDDMVTTYGTGIIIVVRGDRYVMCTGKAGSLSAATVTLGSFCGPLLHEALAGMDQLDAQAA